MNSRVIILLAFVAAGGVPLAAEQSQSQFLTRITEANESLRRGEYEKAIAQFDAAQLQVNTASPDYVDELKYNKAIALYRNGEIAAAENLFADVALSLDDALAAKARFNSGNCHYAAAMQVRDSDRDSAIEQLNSAIVDFRSALAIDNADMDARANIELAAKLLDQLRQEAEREQQQQDDRQQSQEQQEQDQQQDQNRQQEQDQQQESDQQQQQDQQRAQDQQQQQDQQRAQDQQQAQDQQPQQSDQERSDSDKPEQDKQSQNSPDQSKAAESKQENQSGEGQDSQQSEPQQAQDADSSQQNPTQSRTEQNAQSESSQDQPTPADETDTAEQPPTGELQAAGDEAPQPQDLEPPAAMVATDGKMTDEEASKMLQAIRDRDMLRRMRRESAERARRVPVDKDW